MIQRRKKVCYTVVMVQLRLRLSVVSSAFESRLLEQGETCTRDESLEASRSVDEIITATTFEKIQ